MDKILCLLLTLALVPAVRADELTDYILSARDERTRDFLADYYRGYRYVGFGRQRCQCVEYGSDGLNKFRGFVTVSLPFIAKADQQGRPELRGARVAPWSTLVICAKRLGGRDGEPWCHEPPVFSSARN